MQADSNYANSLGMHTECMCGMRRFRGSDGAFHDGVAAGADGAHALLRFARPTKPYQLADARVPLAALLPARLAPDSAPQLAPGARVIVLPGWAACPCGVVLICAPGSGANGIMNLASRSGLLARRSPCYDEALDQAPDMLSVLDIFDAPGF